jgi:hypothetical protein
MSLKRTNMVFAMIGCAWAAASGGCSTPWTAQTANQQPAPRTAAIPDTGATITTATTASDADEQPDFAGVLDKLQQVRAIDPAAEQKLLDELRKTPAESWPLVAEQFRASLAYHEQLAAKSGPRRREGAASREARIVETGVAAAGADPPPVVPGLQMAASQPSPASAVNRPSAPIGELLDPRNADADGVSSEALAAATPYSNPVPISPPAAQDESVPRRFTSDGAPSPIESDGSKPTVAQTSLEVTEQLSAEQIAKSQGNGPLAPIDPRTGADWQQLIEQAAEDLNRCVVESPSTTAEVHQHVSLRMLQLMAGDTEKALEPIPHISPIEQDFWSRQLLALATYLDHHSQPDDKRRAAASVTHLDDAVSQLRELGSLSLRNLSFAKKVYGYGAIEPFERDVFSPGEQVSLYVEVENYHSQSTEKGFCTLLGSTYEILNEKDERVAGDEFPDVDDCCRSRRRDFHIQYGLSLPAKLTPGRYRLQLVIKDRQSDKRGNATVEFEIQGNL